MGNRGFRLRFAAVEHSHGVGANRPRQDLRDRGLLAFAIRTFIGRADEAAFDERVRAFLDRLSDVFRKSRAEDADPVPLGLRGPLILRVLPGSLCGDQKNREFRPVAARLALPGIGTNKPIKETEFR